MDYPPSSRTMPRSLGPFRLIKLLGQGGFAPVWRAEEVYGKRKLRDVAIKLFFRPEAITPRSSEADQWRDDVINEAGALCRVEHPNVVRFYTLHWEDNRGVVGLVMEYVRGPSLDVVLRQHGPFEALKVLDVGISVAWALAAVHDAGLVHRDIKPENIIQAPSGHKLIDFGIVVDAPPSPGQGGPDASPWPPRIIGTPGYIAPEYIGRGGLPSPAGDLYALGVTLSKLATGALPGVAPQGEPAQGPLFELISLLLDPDPNVRPHHADWVARELEAIHRRLAPLGAPGSVVPSTQPSSLTGTATATGLPAIAALLDLAPRIQPPLTPLFDVVRRACEGGGVSDAGAALGELGLGVLRYAFALGMALVAAASATQLEGSLAEQLRGAARATHFSWCSLLRAIHKVLGAIDPSSARLFAFAQGPSLDEQIGALLRHASSFTAPEAWAPDLVGLLEGAASLLSIPLSGQGTEEPTRPAGPKPSGSASTEIPAPADLYLIVGVRRIRISPWLPQGGGQLLLPEAPAAAGRPWRAVVPVSGERRDDPQLDKAMRRLLGEGDGGDDLPPDLCLHPPLTGRTEPLAMLGIEARAAAQGSVRIVLLTGPLGIGRTRLLEAAVEQAGVAPERVIRMHCSPERKSPLRPLVAGLGALPARGESAFYRVLGAVERALAPAVLPGAEHGNEALGAVEDALLRAAEESAILLVIDDLQWADTLTLQLLQLLVERADRGAKAKLLILAAARDEPNASAPLRALLGKVRGGAHAGQKRYIPLGPLAAEQTAALAQGVGPLDLDLERFVVQGSGGVPFFLVNALFVFRDIGAIAWRKGAWRAVGKRLLDEEVPGVAALVEARLASYFAPNSPIYRAALRALAAIALHGGGLAMETILHVGGAEENLEDALEALVDAGILAVSGERQEYGFGQEMVRLSVLNFVRGRPWFYRLHRTLLEAIARSPDAAVDAAFLATGYEKLGARTEARAWLGRAMEGAIHAGLFDEAAAFGDRLAALTEEPAARAEVELAIVRALIQGRHLDEAKGRLARLEAATGELPGGSRHADVQRRILLLEVARGRSEAAQDPTLIEDADALFDPTLSGEARMALAGVAPQDEAMELIDAAVGLTERSGRELAHTLALALEFAARVRRVELLYAASRRDLPKAKHDLERALVIARTTSSLWQQIHIEGDLAVLDAEMGSVSAAIEKLGRLAEQAKARGMRGQQRMLLHSLATCLLREGRNAEAAEVAQWNADLAGEAGDPVLRGLALSLRASALFCIGDLDAALESAQEAERLQHERDDPMRALTLLRRAEILEALGRGEEALDDARDAKEEAKRHGQEGVRVPTVLWEALSLVRQGKATQKELRKELDAAKASEVAQHALTRRLIEQVEAWLANVTSPRKPS